MKQKYIKQVDSQNFLYPNNTLAEYDVNIIHDLIEGTVTGTTTEPVLTISGANINVSVDYTWDLNGAEPFYNNQGALNLINVYFQTPDKQYFGNWVNVFVLETFALNTTTTGGTMNFTITPAMMGQTTFSASGNYSITFQCISRRTIYPMPWLIPFTAPTATPTPTPTITPTPGLTVTPTPTPTLTPNPSPTVGTDFYYQGIICGSGIFGQFYSDTNLGESPSVVIRAYSAIGGEQNQCFDSITQIFTPNSNPIIGIYDTCAECTGATYAYYEVTKYNCFPCSLNTIVTARTLSSTTLTTGWFYNNGDGFVYQVTGYAAGPAYDVDLQSSAGQEGCSDACAI